MYDEESTTISEINKRIVIEWIKYIQRKYIDVYPHGIYIHKQISEVLDADIFIYQ